MPDAAAQTQPPWLLRRMNMVSANPAMRRPATQAGMHNDVQVPSRRTVPEAVDANHQDEREKSRYHSGQHRMF